MLYKNLWKIQLDLGNESNPFDCYLAWRGLKTIQLRVRKAEKNAKKIV